MLEPTAAPRDDDSPSPLEAVSRANSGAEAGREPGGAKITRQPPVRNNTPKKKGPIINQRGPNEIDRARKMMHELSGAKGAAPTRKPSAGSSSRGSVVKLDKAKGFGFIMDSAGQQRFFHRSSVLDGGFDNLNEQQPVEFESQQDERGARAVKVRPSRSGQSGQGRAQSRPAGVFKSSPGKPSPAKPALKASGWKSDLSPFRNGAGPSSTKRYKI